MNKKIVLSLLTLSVCVCALQIAEPVAAGTLFDSGKWIGYSAYGYKVTTYYKAYYGDGQVYVKVSGYRNGKNIVSQKIYMRKTSSTNLKSYIKTWHYDTGVETQGGNEYYSGSATSYYWNVLKPLFEAVLNI